MLFLELHLYPLIGIWDEGQPSARLQVEAVVRAVDTCPEGFTQILFCWRRDPGIRNKGCFHTQVTVTYCNIQTYMSNMHACVWSKIQRRHSVYVLVYILYFTDFINKFCLDTGKFFHLMKLCLPHLLEELLRLPQCLHTGNSVVHKWISFQ